VVEPAAADTPEALRGIEVEQQREVKELERRPTEARVVEGLIQQTDIEPANAGSST